QSGQLYEYDYKQDQFIPNAINIHQDPKIIKSPVFDIYPDSNNRVWMATAGGGLICFDNKTKKFNAWMESDGLIMDVCYKLIPDNMGRLWVGTYDGFSVFNILDERIEISKVNEGLQGNNSGSIAKYKMKSGKFLVASSGNLVVIDPMKLTNKPDK